MGPSTILRPDLSRIARRSQRPPLPVPAIKESISARMSFEPQKSSKTATESPISNSPVFRNHRRRTGRTGRFRRAHDTTLCVRHAAATRRYDPSPRRNATTDLRCVVSQHPFHEQIANKFPAQKLNLKQKLKRRKSPNSARQRNQTGPSAHAEATRQMAKAMVGGIQTGRRMNERVGTFIQKFIPRLLPNANSKKPLIVPTYVMIFIAVVIPVVVVTMASVIYLRFGQSIQYDELYRQALTARAQADGANRSHPSARWLAECAFTS